MHGHDFRKGERVLWVGARPWRGVPVRPGDCLTVSALLGDGVLRVLTDRGAPLLAFDFELAPAELVEGALRGRLGDDRSGGAQRRAKLARR